MNRTFHSLLFVIVVSLLSSSAWAQSSGAAAPAAQKSPVAQKGALKSKKSSKKSSPKKNGTTDDKKDSEKNDDDSATDDSSAETSSDAGGFGSGLQLRSPFAESLQGAEDGASDDSTSYDSSSDDSSAAADSGSATDAAGASGGTTSASTETPTQANTTSPQASAQASGSTQSAQTSGAAQPEDVQITETVDESFEPLPDVEESALELILPGELHPRFDFHGYMRLRSAMNVNFDLDTDGTSAILPALGSLGSLPASPNKQVAISTNMRFHIKPVLMITDELSIHSEFDLLDNVVLGSHPERLVLKDSIRPELYRQATTSKQFSISDAIKINQLYGQVDSLFGSLYAGRMDSHFGLGIQDNNGECIDCDYGSNVDSVKVATRLMGVSATASIDFPDEGISSSSVHSAGGQGYDLAQVDDVDQYTFTLFYGPRSDKDKLIEEQRLKSEGKPVVNTALLYRYRTQDGAYTATPQSTANFPTTLPPLVYKGLNVHSFDLWTKFLYNPNDNLFMRLELEGFVNFGGIDNVSEQAVGGVTPKHPTPVNCFDGKDRDKDKSRCTQGATGEDLSRQFVQWGLAFESEFRIGQLASWGLNFGLASGGDTANWGTDGKAIPDYSFARFNRDYHVDLILFRNVIGTVTNAAYIKPHAHFDFLRLGERHLAADVSSIFSFALNEKGTPAGNSHLLGTEFDAALRYILQDKLDASIEGGILFPFAGLGAVSGRPRYVSAASHSGAFTKDKNASIAWTLQGKLTWLF